MKATMDKNDIQHKPKGNAEDKKFKAFLKDITELATDLEAPEDTTEKAIEILHIVHMNDL